MPAPLTVCPLGSGSAGNATLVSGAEGAFLIDAGLSGRDLLVRAEEVGVARDALRGIFVTHCHTDHCRGAGVLARKLGIPIWATRSTLSRMKGLRGSEDLRPIRSSSAFWLAGTLVETLSVSHDAPGTVIVRVNQRFGVATDLGRTDADVVDFLGGLDALLLEFNHDEQLLEDGNYPARLKRRIASEEGHLSNRQAADLLDDPGFEAPRRALWLGHLSEENNTPELAFEEACIAMGASPTEIYLTRQEAPSTAVVLD